MIIGNILIGCNNSKKQIYVTTATGSTIRRTYTTDNLLVSDQEVIKSRTDYVAQGFNKEYYPSGTIKRLTYLENNVAKGNAYTFYQNGKIDSLNIFNGKGYSSVKFQPNRSNLEDSNFYLKHLDTFKVGNYLPIMTVLDLFQGVKTILRIKVTDDKQNVFWDTSITRNCQDIFCKTALTFSYKKINVPGHYTYFTTATYYDEKTNVPVISDTITLNLFVYQ